MQDATRVALVTGAASGLARGVAVGLARAGYRVAFTYKPGGTPPDETQTMLREAGNSPFAVAADALRAGETQHAVHAVEEEFGRVDVLVNAVGPLVVKRFARSSMDDYRAMLDGNLSSAVEAAFAVLPGMRERKFGRLIFFGLTGSSQTLPARGMSLYGAAKAGVVAFARTLSLEEAVHGITVNSIEPGDIRDKDASRADARAQAAKNPSGHAGSWEDIAGAVRFLAADESGFINGATLTVGGGLVLPYE